MNIYMLLSASDHQFGGSTVYVLRWNCQPAFYSVYLVLQAYQLDVREWGVSITNCRTQNTFCGSSHLLPLVLCWHCWVFALQLPLASSKAAQWLLLKLNKGQKRRMLCSPVLSPQRFPDLTSVVFIQLFLLSFWNYNVTTLFPPAFSLILLSYVPPSSS